MLYRDSYVCGPACCIHQSSAALRLASCEAAVLHEHYSGTAISGWRRWRGHNAQQVHQGEVRGGRDDEAGCRAAAAGEVGLADVEVAEVVKAVCADDLQHNSGRQVAHQGQAHLQAGITYAISEYWCCAYMLALEQKLLRALLG